ncbi:hypothetical protein [Methylobacterium aquaticum]|uniref:hypothetical protein n=1 Tax=Methylobacterium aquaticum TaxID=270351 RepID=UPI000B230A5E|nr:hypothetical protein [Methylobacterium aquaticum]
MNAPHLIAARPIGPERAAQLLHDRGLSPALVETDTAMAEALFAALVEASIPRRYAPIDFPAVRAALVALTLPQDA